MNNEEFEKLKDIANSAQQLSDALSSFVKSVKPIDETVELPQSQTTEAKAEKIPSQRELPGLTDKMATSLPVNLIGPKPDTSNAAWPIAVDATKNLPSDGDERDKRFRAVQIFCSLTGHEDKNVLDFGCGTGHIARELSNSAKRVTAYDIKEYADWASMSKDNLTISSNRNIITENGPYDYILLYDVLDHLIADDPNAIMQLLASVLNPDSTIFCVCHPWTSRHGGHIYNQKNLAYLHMALTPAELTVEGLKPAHNLKLIRPMAAYESWFSNAGLTVISKAIANEEVPTFIENIIDRIIKINWAGKIDADTALKIMANQFITYYLTK